MGMETEMIEISVEISDTTTYDINIPKVINQNTYPEIMKRLKAVHGMLPVAELDINPRLSSILLRLEREETEDVIKLYETSKAEAFSEYLTERYKIEGKSRANITSIIGRMRKRLAGLKGVNDGSV